MRIIKLLFLFAFIFYSSNCVFGQLFYVNFNSTPDTFGTEDPYFIFTGEISNLDTAQSLEIIIQISPINLDSNWYIAMCTPNGCFGPGHNRDTFVLDKTQTENIWVELYSNGVLGSGGIATMLINSLDTLNFEMYASYIPAYAYNLYQMEHRFIKQIVSVKDGSIKLLYNIKKPGSRLLILDNRGVTVEDKLLDKNNGIIELSSFKRGFYTAIIRDENSWIYSKLINL